jgi:carboxymethylenebutenolidase
MCLDCSRKAIRQASAVSVHVGTKALDDPSLTHGPVTILNRETQINGYLARPSTRTPTRAIIITHGNAGLPEDMRNATAQLAQAGFVGLLLDPTSRAPDPHALSRDFLMSYSYIKLLMTDIQAAMVYLETLEDVRHDGLGLLGFCGGGVLNLLFAATHPGIRAVVAFYAPPRVTPGTNSASDPRPDMISFVAQFPMPLQYHVGTADEFIPPADLRDFETELSRYKIRAEVYRYAGAGHGFYHYSYPDEYQPEAAAQAHQRMCNFFHRHLD